MGNRLSTNRNKIVVIQEHVDEIFAGPHRRIVGRFDRGRFAADESR